MSVTKEQIEEFIIRAQTGYEKPDDSFYKIIEYLRQMPTYNFTTEYLNGVLISRGGVDHEEK